MYRMAERKLEVYGVFPKFVRKYCGRVLAESFSGRVLSIAGIPCCGQANVALATSDVGMVVQLVSLRMNSALIEQMFEGSPTAADMIRKMAAAAHAKDKKLKVG